MANQYERLLFGIKVKQLRQQNSLTFSELAERCGVSVSYLNEIENGKKYPHDDKAEQLALALGTTFTELSSPTLPANLQPVGDLLRSHLLEELPLDTFGIDISKIVEIITNAPARVSAFISALIDISRKYEMQEENFFFAALRSYQKLFDNYFEEWEAKIDQFALEHDLPKDKAIPLAALQNILKQNYKYKLDKTTLGLYPELRGLRSLCQAEKKRLLIHPQLDETQEKFVLAKEIAYKYFKLKDRVYTSNLFKVSNFEEAIHNFKTSYFAVAVLLNRERLLKDIDALFAQTSWNNGAFLLQLIQQYAVSPEMLFQRMTNLLPKHYGLRDMFFLRMNHTVGTDRFVISKELHLARPHQPHGNEMKEHYCRRWISVRLLQDLYKQQQKEDKPSVIVGAQISRYFDSEDEYLCITMARSGHPTPNSNVSVTIGIAVNEVTRQQIKFLGDSTIPIKWVQQTCERCPATDCNERVTPPIILDNERRQRKVQESITQLLKA